MKEFLITILETYFLHVLYSDVMIYKLKELFKTDDITADGNVIRAGNINIYLTLSDNNYINKIDIEEISK